MTDCEYSHPHEPERCPRIWHPTDTMSDAHCRLLARRAYDMVYGATAEDDSQIYDRDSPYEFDLHDEIVETMRCYGATMPAHGSDDEDWNEALAPRYEVQ